ncbi:GDP-mannose 4,6-dehydratase [Campylobacter devanensis]|uniref:GDP-mannose 4,6-dehydratase n=1 Tax=Campylobacter devanensis TaxID=3161138 RepID=UPI000A33D9EB|nr:GDP-mannose 4,6-dehydratase [Campylobacter sp. P0021]
MKALITGFTGQVGSQMADFLLKNTDYEVIGMMRLQCYFQSHIVVRIPSRQTIAPSDYIV